MQQKDVEELSIVELFQHVVLMNEKTDEWIDEQAEIRAMQESWGY